MSESSRAHRYMHLGFQSLAFSSPLYDNFYQHFFHPGSECRLVTTLSLRKFATPPNDRYVFGGGGGHEASCIHSCARKPSRKHFSVAFLVLEGNTAFDCSLEQVQRNRDPHCVDTDAEVKIEEVKPANQSGSSS